MSFSVPHYEMSTKSNVAFVSAGTATALPGARGDCVMIDVCVKKWGKNVQIVSLSVSFPSP